MFAIEFGVIAVAGYELVVGTLLHYASLVEDGYGVGVADGGNAVGDEDGSAPLHDFAEVVEDLVFGVGVNAGESVVENEDSRAAEQGAGYGGALLLASGESDAALAYGGFVAFGKTFDVVGYVGGFGGGLDVVWRGFSIFLGYAIGYVCADGVAEKESFLGNESDLTAQRVERELADGDAVDQDGAGVGVVDAWD